MQVLPFRRCLRGFMWFEESLEPLRVVDGRGPARGRLAYPVETGIDSDAVQPGGDGGLTAEGTRGTEGGDQGVLDGVGRFLTVAEGAQRHGPQPVPMAAYQLAEGVGVTGHMASEEV